ncbi:unnamed protein product [Oikopleura dioica]|uniref:Uncharacterized protein n=1 Tax=Oikopleura dioica TaxID=34765 RepID=E4YBX3_OIKDI|nr:unnamed protein product [Oikopleura dioica]
MAFETALRLFVPLSHEEVTLTVEHLVAEAFSVAVSDSELPELCDRTLDCMSAFVDSVQHATTLSKEGQVDILNSIPLRRFHETAACLATESCPIDSNLSIAGCGLAGLKREPSFRPHVVQTLHFLLTQLQHGPLRINLANELLRLPRSSFLFLYGYRMLDSSRAVIPSVLTRTRFYKRFEYRVIDELCRIGTLPDSAKPSSPDSLPERYAKPTKCYATLHDEYTAALAAEDEQTRLRDEAGFQQRKKDHVLDSSHEPMSVAMSTCAPSPPLAAYYVAETNQGMIVTRYEPLPTGDERTKVIGAVTTTATPVMEESASMELVPEGDAPAGGPSTSESTDSTDLTPTGIRSVLPLSTSDNVDQLPVRRNGADTGITPRRTTRSMAQSVPSSAEESAPTASQPRDQVPQQGVPVPLPQPDGSSSGSSDSGRDPDPVPNPEPANVTMFRTYEARGLIHQMNNPTRGRRHQKNMGPIGMADTRSVQQYTAASVPGEVPEQHRRVRDRLWQPGSAGTTPPAVYLPSAEFLDAYLKGLSAVVRGVPKVNTPHFGPQPDPIQLQTVVAAYVEANLYVAPSAIRRLLEEFNRSPDIDVKKRILDSDLPDLIQRGSVHLQVLLMKDLSTPLYYRHVIGEADLPVAGELGLYLVDGLTFDQTVEYCHSLLALIGQRAVNMLNRGLVRFLSEEKHSPGFNHFFTKAYGGLGFSTLDVNCGLYALPTELVDGGQVLQMTLYSQPGYNTPGCYLRVHWPLEFKTVGSTHYLEYVEQSSVLLTVLRIFGFTTEVLPADGDIVIDMSVFDESLAPLLAPYADTLLRAEDGYLQRRYPLPERIYYPPHQLPDELQPAAGPAIMRADMTQGDRDHLYAVYRQFLDNSPVMLAYLAEGDQRRRHVRAQTALVGVNPHLYAQSAMESRAAMDRLKVHLHQPLSPLNAFRPDVFVPTLTHLPRNGCGVPYCSSRRCPTNEELYQEVLGALVHYQTQIEPTMDWSAYSAEHFRANSGKLFPDSEQKRLELELKLPIREAGRPDLRANTEPPLTEYLRERGYDVETVVLLLAERHLRAYGVYRNPGSSGRTSFKVDTCIPAAFYLTGDRFTGLVSLRVSLPTRLTVRLLCLEPAEPQPIMYNPLRDNGRGRARR